MDELRHYIAWLNDSTVKTVALLIGGVILKKWEPFVNKAIGFGLLVVSAFVSTLSVLFPGSVPGPDAVTSSFVFAQVGGVEFVTHGGGFLRAGSWLWNTAVPAVAAVGLHSLPKNTGEWLKLGVGLFWPGGRPPKKS